MNWEQLEVQGLLDKMVNKEHKEPVELRVRQGSQEDPVFKVQQEPQDLRALVVVRDNPDHQVPLDQQVPPVRMV